MLEVVPGSEVYPATECLQACSPVSTKSGIVHHGPTTCIFDKRHVNTREPCSNKNMLVNVTMCNHISIFLELLMLFFV